MKNENYAVNVNSEKMKNSSNGSSLNQVLAKIIIGSNEFSYNKQKVKQNYSDNDAPHLIQ